MKLKLRKEDGRVVLKMLKHNFAGRREGAIIHMPPAEAKDWIKRGWAEQYEVEKD